MRQTSPRQQWSTQVRNVQAALAVVVLPLLLAACDGGTPTPPAADTPAPAPAVEVQQPAATVEPVAPARELDLQPVVGSWGFDAPTCSAPIAIDGTSFRGLENVCEVTGWTVDGDTYTATMTCTGEGTTTSERLAMTALFGPQGEGLRLNHLDRGGDPVLVFRCRAPRSQ